MPITTIEKPSAIMHKVSEGKKQNEFAECHVALHGMRNGIIMRNTIYVGNKLTEECVLFSCQFYKSSTLFDVVDSGRISNN